MNRNKFLPLTETTYYILLSLLSPLHGYGIMQRIEELSEGDVRIAAGTLYGALENLMKQKLIELVGVKDEERRKVYVLTDFGREILVMEHERLRRLSALSEELLGRNKDESI